MTLFLACTQQPAGNAATSAVVGTPPPNRSAEAPHNATSPPLGSNANEATPSVVAPSTAPNSQAALGAPLAFERFIGAGCARTRDGATWCQQAPYQFAKVPTDLKLTSAVSAYPMMVFLAEGGQVYYYGHFEPEAKAGHATHYAEPRAAKDEHQVKELLPWASGYLMHRRDGTLWGVRTEVRRDQWDAQVSWGANAPQPFVEGRHSRAFSSGAEFCVVGPEHGQCRIGSDTFERVFAQQASEVSQVLFGGDRNCLLWSSGRAQCWERAVSTQPNPGYYLRQLEGGARADHGFVRMAMLSDAVLAVDGAGALWFWSFRFSAKAPERLERAGEVADVSTAIGNCLIAHDGQLLCYVNTVEKPGRPIPEATPVAPEFLRAPLVYGNISYQ